MENISYRAKIETVVEKKPWLTAQKKATLIFVGISGLQVIMGLACSNGGQGEVVRNDSGQAVQCEGGGALGFLKRLLEDNPWKAC